MTLPGVWPRAMHLGVHYGLAVAPLSPRVKVPPAGTNGVLGASSHPEQIERMAHEYPLGNYVIATGGHLNLLGMDFDSFEALALFTERFGIRPTTPTVRTPRPGVHEYYVLPRGVELRNSAGRLGANVDTRGHGGYFVGPGSSLPNGEYVETVSFDDVDIAMLPDNIIAALQKPLPTKATARVLPMPTPNDDVTERCARYMAKMPSLADGQGRNQSAFRLAAFVLHTLNQTTADAWTALAVWNSRNVEPMPSDRLEAIIANASRYGARAA